MVTVDVPATILVRSAIDAIDTDSWSGARVKPFVGDDRTAFFVELMPASQISSVVVVTGVVPVAGEVPVPVAAACWSNTHPFADDELASARPIPHVLDADRVAVTRDASAAVAVL